MARKVKYMIVAAMKNEGPYILEWVSHHLALGFQHIVVVTNDCDDGTTRILDRLAELGHVTHVPNPKMLHRNRGAWHVSALRYSRLLNIVRDAEWVMHCDADEFLQLKTEEKSLDYLLECFGTTDVVSFTSMPFNSSGQKKLRNAPVVVQFTQNSKSYNDTDANAAPIRNAIKTMFRNEIDFRTRRSHRPHLHDFSKRNLIWRNGSGKTMDHEFTDGDDKGIDALVSVEFAQLNHYAIRSIESFLLKLDRGDAMGTDRLNNWLRYWNSYNQVGDDDFRWVKPSELSLEHYDTFLQDPELAELHERAYASHASKVARILETKEGKKMAEALGYFDS